jgi:hypothetical protein
LIFDVYDFTFNELPVKMGIPDEFIRKDVLRYPSSDSEDFDKERELWRRVMDIKIEFEKKPFDISIAYDSAKEIIRKYYTGQ